MEACKLTASRDGRRIEFEVLAGKPVVLGRSPQCEVVLADPEVSRQHCRIAAMDGRVLVTDLDSSHGIVYRGSRAKTIEIELGDGFHLGHTFVRFDAILQDRSAPKPAAAPAAPTAPTAAAASTASTAATSATTLPPGNIPTAAPAAPTPTLESTAVGQQSTDLPTGTGLGSFVVERVLGRSDRCTVYEAVQTSLQRRVALKVLRVADGITGVEDRRVFVADALATAAVRDSAMVQVFESADDGTHCYAALELVDGAPLSTSLAASQRLHWQELLPVLADAAMALQHIHEQGHVHGAVKPSNVFALHRGGGRLADRRAGTALRPRETTAYAAPEVLRGEAPGAAADLYSLGCVAYAVLTGRPPFWGSPKQILEEQRARRPAELATVDATLPRALDQLVCEQLLAPDAMLRPASAQACHAAMLALLAPHAPPAPAAAPSPSPAAPAPAFIDAPEPAQVPAWEPRLAAGNAEPVMQRRQPSAAKSFSARLAADAIIFGMVSAVLLVLLVLLKLVGAFDLYSFFGIATSR